MESSGPNPSFPFDFRNLWPDRVIQSRGESAWLDLWTEATNWWVDPAVAGAETLAASNERILAQLVDGIAGRFEGRRVEFSIGGRPVQAVLDWIRLRHIGTQFEARVDLTDIEAAGWSLTSLSVVAASVRIEITAAPQLEISGVEVVGRSPWDAFIPWLDAHIRDWTLRLDADGRVEARRTPRNLSIVIEPFIHDGHLNAELRALCWRGLRLPLPAWLRLVRRLALPVLPRGTRLLEAHRRGGVVEFRATSDGLVEELELARLRNAIAGRLVRDSG